MEENFRDKKERMVTINNSVRVRRDLFYNQSILKTDNHFGFARIDTCSSESMSISGEKGIDKKNQMYKTKYEL